jgi:hypothetical protein
MSGYTNKDHSSIFCTSGIVPPHPYSARFCGPCPTFQWVAGTLHRVKNLVDFITQLHLLESLWMNVPHINSHILLHVAVLKYKCAVHIVIIYSLTQNFTSHMGATSAGCRLIERSRQGLVKFLRSFWRVFIKKGFIKSTDDSDSCNKKELLHELQRTETLCSTYNIS